MAQPSYPPGYSDISSNLAEIHQTITEAQALFAKASSRAEYLAAKQKLTRCFLPLNKANDLLGRFIEQLPKRSHDSDS